jgi:hypothetical protein
MFFAAVFGVLCALAMGGIWLWRGMPSAAAAAVLWLVYALYELLMYVRLLCSGECNIRVDLLLVWPVLVIVSIVALKQSFFTRRD